MKIALRSLMIEFKRPEYHITMSIITFASFEKPIMTLSSLQFTILVK